MNTNYGSQNFLCIVGGQRTGTTALRSILSTTGLCKNHDEIFHLENLTEGSFVQFVKENQLTFESWSRYHDAVRIADMYFSYLLATSDKPMHIIDIKINAWYAIQPVWRYPSEPPFLLEYILGKKIPIILTARENILDQILSEEIARKIGKWHNATNEDVDSRFTVPAGTVMPKLKQILLTEKILYNHIKHYSHLHVAVYEDIFTDNILNVDIVSFLERYLDKTLNISQRGTVNKNKIDKTKIIENYQDLKAIVDDHVKNSGRFFKPVNV